MAGMFNERSFQVKQWLKAGKRPDHLSWADLNNPDLQMELVFTGARKYRFAVECKWRRECIDGTIKWAEVPQIYNYERFQRETGIRVFVAIGVGGEPHDPERLYVMPLGMISGNFMVAERDLISFGRRSGNGIFMRGGSGGSGEEW